MLREAKKRKLLSSGSEDSRTAVDPERLSATHPGDKSRASSATEDMGRGARRKRNCESFDLALGDLGDRRLNPTRCRDVVRVETRSMKGECMYADGLK